MTKAAFLSHTHTAVPEAYNEIQSERAVNFPPDREQTEGAGVKRRNKRRIVEQTER